ncbi:MAG: GNAT family N-acetyltransferase [Spirochaetales bacterium]|nr:GNAT family N-acetyltransferase [Spirochaetales bacterium]
MIVVSRKITNDEEYEELIPLIREYMEWLGEDICFQEVDRELETLSSLYGPDGGGAAFLGRSQKDGLLGCACLRALPSSGKEVCEMKRLFVRPSGRGMGLGRMLSEQLIREARTLGYRKMRLDTLEKLTSARALYESLGFKRIEPYYENPLEGALFYELTFN